MVAGEQMIDKTRFTASDGDPAGARSFPGGRGKEYRKKASLAVEMTIARTPRKLLAPVCAVPVAALLLAGCGSGGASATTHASSAQDAAATVARAPVATVPTLRLRILSPRSGAHTGQTLSVSVRLTGDPSGASGAFHYLLDGRESRNGSAHLTFHELAPGRHRLVVMLGSDAGVRATSFFVVRAPAPPPPEPAQPAPAPSTMPAQQPSEAPAPAQTQAPTRTPATPRPSPPPTTSTPTPPPGEGIPQGGGGDGDGDNNGGPSDGDGNV